MGILVGQYTESFLSDTGDRTHEPEDLTQAWLSFTHTISGDNAFIESLRVDMKDMVNERNDLVHHFLPRWQPQSDEHMAEATIYLDKQREKVLPIAEHLTSVLKSWSESRQKIATIFATDGFEQQLELVWLQSSPLIILLREFTNQKARPDGWVHLADAGQIARLKEPDAVAHMKNEYGYSTLKQLLIASELFDVLDEPLPNGGFRTLYRAKPPVL